MKLKVTKKDFIIFGVFCFILFFLCCIAVLNIMSFLNEGEFYGLNPFGIFEKSSYIFATIFVFIVVIIAIVASVSSSIFEFDHGIGFELLDQKKESGYSRWLKEKEMKKAFKVYKVGVKDEKADRAGTVFINDGKNMWVDDSENHTLVIGVTGSGKTSAVVDPLIYSLCKNGESMVITDPKGEIFKDHSELLKARGYKIIVLNFRQPNLGNAWNPLTLPYQLYKEGNVDKSVELVDDVAGNILKDKSSQDPFWENSAADYFSGCALGLFQDCKDELQVNLNSINLMTTTGEDKYGAGSTYIKEYFTLKGEQSTPYVFASNTINSPTETKGSILSVFRQKIRLFASREQLSEMLAYSDFNMRDIGKESTAVFITIHDEKTTYHALATIFIKQCYETLIDVAQENGGKLPHRTNFILDEFANMPPLKDVTTMVTAARSRQIRFTFIIQNFAQLNEVYGEHDAETIRSNCQNLIYLLTTELSALEEISKLCGEKKSKDDEKTASTPLITVSDLQKLEMNEVIILRNRLNPFRTKLKQAYTIDWGDKQFGKGKFQEREKKEVQLFDIKEFVTLRKKSKMEEKLNGGTAGNAGGGFSGLMAGGSNPFAGGSNPFAGGTGGARPAGSPPSFEEFMAARNGGVNNTTVANNSNPSSNLPTPPSRPKMPTFDVDALVKKIDAKIAELEAQEKAENAGKEAKPVEINEKPLSVPNSVDPVKIADNGNSFNDFKNKTTNDNFKTVDTSAINNNIDEVVKAPRIEPKIIQPEQTSNKFATFNDVLNANNSTELPQNKPSIMISNPIGESKQENKPLGGIIDPMTSVKMSDFRQQQLSNNSLDAPLTENNNLDSKLDVKLNEVSTKAIDSISVSGGVTIGNNSNKEVIPNNMNANNIPDSMNSMTNINAAQAVGFSAFGKGFSMNTQAGNATSIIRPAGYEERQPIDDKKVGVVTKADVNNIQVNDNNKAVGIIDKDSAGVNTIPNKPVDDKKNETNVSDDQYYDDFFED